MIKKLILFTALEVILVCGYFLGLHVASKKVEFTQGTISGLCSIPEGRRPDLLFMGSSHAQTFSLCNNHALVEGVINKTFVNIGLPAAGPVPESLFLNYFYSKSNTASEIVYFIDPFVLASKFWNQNWACLPYEPYDTKFFVSHVIFSELSLVVKCRYIQSKFKDLFLKKNYNPKLTVVTRSLTAVDPVVVQQRMAAMYCDGSDIKMYRRYEGELFKLSDEIARQGGRIIFIIPPTLLGPMPLMPELKESLESIKAQYHFPYYDYSQAINDPANFFDHDHLNPCGIAIFAKDYLAPLLAKRK